MVNISKFICEGSQHPTCTVHFEVGSSTSCVQPPARPQHTQNVQNWYVSLVNLMYQFFLQANRQKSPQKTWIALSAFMFFVLTWEFRGGNAEKLNDYNDWQGNFQRDGKCAQVSIEKSFDKAYRSSDDVMDDLEDGELHETTNFPPLLSLVAKLSGASAEQRNTVLHCYPWGEFCCVWISTMIM